MFSFFIIFASTIPTRIYSHENTEVAKIFISSHSLGSLTAISDFVFDDIPHRSVHRRRRIFPQGVSQHYAIKRFCIIYYLTRTLQGTFFLAVSTDPAFLSLSLLLFLFNSSLRSRLSSCHLLPCFPSLFLALFRTLFRSSALRPRRQPTLREP